MDRKRKEDQKSYSGEGGIGFLVNKRVGRIEEVRVSKKNEILWIKVTSKEDLFLAVVYMTPEGSTRDSDSQQLLLELEKDILEFSKLGRVIVMGDFNTRIGNVESSILKNDVRYSFPRRNQDHKFGSQIRERGIRFVESMNACNMVILNGLETEAECTCINITKGQSVVDYIIIQDKLILKEEVKKRSRYRTNTMKVWTEEITRVSDHRLVTCEIEIETQLIENQEKEQEKEDKWQAEEEIVGWNRKDKGENKFWEKLVKTSEKIVPEFLEQIETITTEGEKINNGKYVEELINLYKTNLNSILEVESRKRKRIE